MFNPGVEMLQTATTAVFSYLGKNTKSDLGSWRKTLHEISFLDWSIRHFLKINVQQEKNRFGTKFPPLPDLPYNWLQLAALTLLVW